MIGVDKMSVFVREFQATTGARGSLKKDSASV